MLVNIPTEINKHSFELVGTEKVISLLGSEKSAEEHVRGLSNQHTNIGKGLNSNQDRYRYTADP